MTLAVRNLAALVSTVVLTVSMSGAALAEPSFSFDATPGKLPKAVTPVRYAIELKPDLGSLTLAGVEVVDIEVREPTAGLVLNAVDMTIGAASIDDEAQRGGGSLGVGG
jgi:aminopeptidase N